MKFRGGQAKHFEGRPLSGEMGRKTWGRMYLIGLEASRHLDPIKSFDEIGHRLGFTKQHARAACMVALGKVVLAMRKLIQDEL